MRVARSRVFLVMVCLALVLGAGGVVLDRWVASEAMRALIVQRASQALGVPVEAGAVSLQWLPVPGVVASGLVLRTRAPLRLGELVLRPAWWPLVQGRLEVGRLVLRDAVVSQAAVAQLAQARAGGRGGSGAGSGEAGAGRGELVIHRVVLERLQWLAQAGWSSTLDVDLELDDGLPREVSAQVNDGRWKSAQARLRPVGQAWELELRIGGGLVQGPLRWVRSASGLRLDGELQTRGVEVAAVTAPTRVLSGRLEASTVISGQSGPGESVSALLDRLESRTQFTIRQAVLHGLDLGRAVRTVGMSRGGQTEFESLTGQVLTRGQGVVVRDLVARSGLLVARADVQVSASRALAGRVVVDMAGGVVGVPLALGGTVDAPEVNLTRAAMLGAAVGTAVMPGVGTGVGARLGDRIGEGFKGLFGR